MMGMLVKDLLAKNPVFRELLASMTWKSTMVLSGAGVLATWMAAAPPSSVGMAPTPRPSGAGQGSSIEAQVEEEASKLEVRLRQNAAYAVPDRNPFRFNARRAQERLETPQSAPPPAAVIAPPRVTPPLPVLAGMATDIVDGAEQRTAILSLSGAVVLAREGDELAGRYRVNRVEAEAVELVRLDDGSLVRIGLKP
jgi:hypothetical protein